MKRKQEIVDNTFAPPLKRQKLSVIERENLLELLRETYSGEQKVVQVKKEVPKTRYSPVKGALMKKRYFSGPMKECEDLLRRLKNNEVAGPFKHPVDRSLVPDYYFVVKHPMDFTTIEKKFSRYKRVEEFRDDVLKIFTNCRLYNPPNSELRRYADILKKQFERHWTGIMAQASAVLDTNYQITDENLKTFKEEKKKKKKKEKKKSRSKPRKRSRKRPSKKKAKKKKKKSKISTDQKQEMIRIIPLLSEEQQTKIIGIVKRYHKTEEDDEGAVTLDLDTYNNNTLQKLWNFVQSQKSTIETDEEDDDEFF